MTKASKKEFSSLKLCSEVLVVYRELSLGLGIKLPYRLLRSFITTPELLKLVKRNWIKQEIGDGLMEVFNKLGPVYGKMGQVYLSRLNESQQKSAESWNLNRLYSDWPPLASEEIEIILDTEIPEWRGHFHLDPKPLGIASMAQVHVLTRESDSKEFVVKVLKPLSVSRLLATTAALEQISASLKVLAVTKAAKKSIKELDEFISALLEETSLIKERENILRMKAILDRRKNKVLRLPEVDPNFCSDKVIVMEKFEGPSLASIVSGKVEITKEKKRLLARKVLKELLIQVFEIGLFHGDPHAGNLILLDDGSIGLFDWGLAGELTETDRVHIAAILKAVMAMDMDDLAEALAVMAEDSGVEVSSKSIKKELKSITKLIQKAKANKKKLGLDVLMNKCLDAAAKLDIPVPDGLLLMAKSLLTIEGLAKGIDPEIKTVRVASPVLFKAAKPGLNDIIKMSKKLPKLAGLWFAPKT